MHSLQIQEPVLRLAWIRENRSLLDEKRSLPSSAPRSSWQCITPYFVATAEKEDAYQRARMSSQATKTSKIDQMSRAGTYEVMSTAVPSLNPRTKTSHIPRHGFRQASRVPLLPHEMNTCRDVQPGVLKGHAIFTGFVLDFVFVYSGLKRRQVD